MSGMREVGLARIRTLRAFPCPLVLFMKHFLAICAIVKNEHDYLLEWIAYHRVVGVDRLLIYNNSGQDDDGTTELLSNLQRIGVVEVVPWPDLPKWHCREGVYSRPQIPAYYDGVGRLRNEAEWVAFIDADEFIVPMREDDLPSTLKLYRNFGGVGPNWRMFGSSGAQKRENLPVCKRFTMAASRDVYANRHVKTIAKPELIGQLITHRPFLKSGVFVDEHGREITDKRGIHDSVSYDIIRINHYFTKSHEEWLKKIERGMADCQGNRPEDKFFKSDHNDERDTFILKFYDATMQEMQALASAAKVRNYPSMDKIASQRRGKRSSRKTQRSSASNKAGHRQRIVDVHLMGGFANRMIQYMVVRRIAAEVEDCLISNVVLPEWGIDHPALPGGPGPEIKIPETTHQVKIGEIAQMLSSGDETRVNFKSYAQWFPNFPELEFCRSLFPANEREYPGYGPECLVCNVRGAETLDARHRHYVLLPIKFYADMAQTTGLKLVFMGQIEENVYCRALKERFPDAVFHPSRGAMADFQTFRNSKNLVPAVSTFSWLAAWLSRADQILFPVNGLFHPVQEPTADLLPCADERYKFYLFPINYAVSVNEFESAHRAIENAWRPVGPEVLSKLRTPRTPKRLQYYVSKFDEEYYLHTYKNIAAAVRPGGFRSALDHYIKYGFAEGRNGFAFDYRWYSREYPLAAQEVGQGDYADLMHHYVEVGAKRGYKPRTKRILDVHLMGGFANRMIQYMVVRRIAVEAGDCLISNAVLPEWGIDHPALPGGPGPEIKIPETTHRVNVAEMARMLSTGEKMRVNFKTYAQWFPNFPDLELCRSMFPANERGYPGYGSEYLVCNVRGGEILDARHRQYVLLPIEFYAELVRTTGLKLVFMGQIEANAYCRALKERFPDAVFHPSRGAMADFQTFRNSKNLVPAVSTFSWLAAWLSRADQILFPVNGLFHPVQEPTIDLLPCGDERYEFYLFPINYAVSVDRFENAHRALHDGWHCMTSEAIAALRTATPRWPRRIDRYVAFFDEKFYLQTWPDVARAVKAGVFSSGLEHYVKSGFREGHRRCFPFDPSWYSMEYPLAAFEVGQGDYLDLMHHYVEVGAMRGYKPVKAMPEEVNAQQ